MSNNLKEERRADIVWPIWPWTFQWAGRRLVVQVGCSRPCSPAVSREALHRVHRESRAAGTVARCPCDRDQTYRCRHTSCSDHVHSPAPLHSSTLHTQPFHSIQSRSLPWTARLHQPNQKPVSKNAQKYIYGWGLALIPTGKFMLPHVHCCQGYAYTVCPRMEIRTYSFRLKGQYFNHTVQEQRPTSECSNYHPIPLLSVPGKVCATIDYNR